MGYWPTATGELAARINATPKLVVSTTAEELAWQNARQLLVDDDLPRAIADLKAISPARTSWPNAASAWRRAWHATD